MNIITRTQMIEDLSKMIESREIREKEAKGFAKEGSAYRRKKAAQLRSRLQCGENPSQRELSGHYGKGTVFAESE